MSSVTMPFGKYKGVILEDLPDQYLAWLLSATIELREPLLGFVRNEAFRRDRIREAERAAALITPEVLAAALDIIKQGVRVLTRAHHPDAGGSAPAMVAVNNAAELLRVALAEMASRYV
jgi:hypothetical protein